MGPNLLSSEGKEDFMKSLSLSLFVSSGSPKLATVVLSLIVMTGCQKARFEKVTPPACPAGQTCGQGQVQPTWQQPVVTAPAPVIPAPVTPPRPQGPAPVLQVIDTGPKPVEILPTQPARPTGPTLVITPVVDKPIVPITPVVIKPTVPVTVPAAVPVANPPTITSITIKTDCPPGQKPTVPVKPAPVVIAPAPVKPVVTPAPVKPTPVVITQPTEQCGIVESLPVANVSSQKLDILIVNDTRVRAAEASDKLVSALANKFAKGGSHEGSQVRIGFLPALSKLDARHGKLMELPILSNQPKKNYIELKDMSQNLARVMIRTNMTRAFAEEKDASNKSVLFGGNAGLVSLESLLTQNLSLAQSQGFLRPDADLHVIFVSGRADMCAATPNGAKIGSQNEQARNATCQGYNDNLVRAALARALNGRTLRMSSIIYTKESDINATTGVVGTGTQSTIQAGIGYGYKELTESYNGAVIPMSNLGEMQGMIESSVAQTNYNTVESQNNFTLKQTPIGGSVVVKVQTLAKCAPGAKCLGLVPANAVRSSVTGNVLSLLDSVPVGTSLRVEYCVAK